MTSYQHLFASTVVLLVTLLCIACPTDAPVSPISDAATDSATGTDFGFADLGGDTAVSLDTKADVAADLPAADQTGADGSPPDTADDSGGLDIPDNPKPPDIPPSDAPCVADCDGKLCGPDGCGGICGYCTFPEVCGPEYTCAVVCETDCVGKFCGNDGCGGTCGDCQVPLECGLDGLCYEPTCILDCSGKVCGSDGCGADCGQCVSPQICQNGSCQLGPCGTVTDTGECNGTVLKWCEDEVILQEDDCAQYEGYTCTYDGQLNKYTCKDTGPCVPNCSGKMCGSNGCGGTCGACNNAWSCVLGTCTPEVGGDCGPFQGVNGCTGDTLWICNPGNVLTKQQCDVAPFNEVCKFDVGQGKFACVDP